MKRLALLLLLLPGCGSEPKATPAEFWAGVATVEITPTRPVPLGGYGNRKGKPMTGVHDPVYAKALWLETRDARVCLITTDLIGSTVEIRDAIRPEGVPLVLTASHNHSGPGGLTKGMWVVAMGKFDPEYHAELTAKLKKLIEDARSVVVPARLGFARGQVPELLRNRRHADGPVDPDLNLILVTDALSRPLAVLANFTAHGTVLSDENFLVSGDWPGAFQRSLEREVGAPVLFTNGAEGDVAPRAPSGRDDFEKCDAIGSHLASRAATLLRGIEKMAERVTISYVERGVDLPTPTLLLAPRKSVLGLLRLNDVRMFCFPGEPAVELGLDLKKRYPGSWVLGLANDHLGYFLTEEEFQKGGYEAKVSFYGPKMGPWLLERLRELGEREDAQSGPGQPEGRSGENHDRR